MYCDLWLQYIQVRKLFKGGNYSRAETIRGNTVNPMASYLCTAFISDQWKQLISQICSLKNFPTTFIRGHLAYLSHWSGLLIFKQNLFQWQNCFKILQIWIILNIQDVWWPGKLKKGQKIFEGQTKARGGKIQIFIIFSTFYD